MRSWPVSLPVARASGPTVVPTKPRRGIGVPTIPASAAAPGVCRAMEIWELGAVELAAALRGRELSRRRGARAPSQERADAIAAPATRSRCASTSARATRPLAADAQLARGDGRPAVRRADHGQGLALHGGRADHVRLARRSSPTCPTETVAAVRRLEAAGAVIFAKTATPEFCYAGTTPGTAQPARPDADARRLLRRRRGRASPPAPARSPSAATAAARSASRPRSAASSASSRRSAPCRASPARRAGRRSSPTARWRAPSPTRG